MGHQGGSLEQVWGPLVYGAARIWDRLEFSYPGCCPRHCQTGRSLRGEATWKVPRRGSQWSAPGASKGEPLALTGHMTLLCCGAPAGMTDSSVLVTSVRDAFPGFDDSTGQQPSLRRAVALEALASFWQPHRCTLSSSRKLTGCSQPVLPLMPPTHLPRLFPSAFPTETPF